MAKDKGYKGISKGKYKGKIRSGQRNGHIGKGGSNSSNKVTREKERPSTRASKE